MQGKGPGPTHGPQHKVLPHQGHPRRRGPSARARDTLRKEAWLKKRQDKQQADPVDLSETSETVSVIDSTVESREVEATEMESNCVPNNVYAWDLCDYSTQTELTQPHQKKKKIMLKDGAVKSVKEHLIRMTS